MIDLNLVAVEKEEFKNLDKIIENKWAKFSLSTKKAYKTYRHQMVSAGVAGWTSQKTGRKFFHRFLKKNMALG